MREQPAQFGAHRDAVFLSKCSAPEAHDWLSGRVLGYSYVYGTPVTPADSHVLEYILYRRNDPSIDLALAEHGRSRSVLQRVYKRGSASIRVAACSNPSLFVGQTLRNNVRIRIDDSIWDIVKNGPIAELRAVCENPYLTSDFYSDLVSLWEGDIPHGVSQAAQEIRLPDARFQKVLLFLSHNPRIATARDDSKEAHYMNEYAEHQYNRLFDKCWELANILPVSIDWAYPLSELYSHLSCPRHVFKDVEAVLARWRPQHEEPFSYTEYVREYIAANFLEPLEMFNSNDAAIRRAIAA